MINKLPVDYGCGVFLFFIPETSESNKLQKKKKIFKGIEPATFGKI